MIHLILERARFLQKLIFQINLANPSRVHFRFLWLSFSVVILAELRSPRPRAKILVRNDN